jgi:hypothetical protein
MSGALQDPKYEAKQIRWQKIPEKIQKLYRHNPNVHLAVTPYLGGLISYGQMLEGLVVSLADTNAKYKDLVERLNSYSVTPTPIMLPHGATLLPVPDFDDMQLSKDAKA